MKNNFTEKKLYRVPEEGMVKGVLAGLAHYFNVPVKLLRVMVVLSLFFGLFAFTVLAYIILSFVLDPAPASRFSGEEAATPHELLDEADAVLRHSERRLREVERYVTSETFGVRSRFRQL
ncbi:envelope stress response membrane protein PspC [Chimaeribacter coloradensis]|uniref:Envelope stress response membrane protein PspC n=1 Tax=Chimaeribacter coloradensis TaxID=2060068 RepID=A0A2N5EDK4_9GAMM|nr:envelope stress response membrane protein PspC [Chimaeribacter coloradensis]PLR40591.1 envelope stress response membrane protein PspC [Chimaeribacter coloradensis]